MSRAALSGQLHSAAAWLRGKLADNLMRFSIVLGILLIPSHQLYDVENSVYDLLVKLRYLGAKEDGRSSPRRIALVLIDDEARRMDQVRRLTDDKGATSRRYLAALIRKLADLESRPAVVGVDFRLDRPSSPGEDEALARAIGHATESGIRIVLPTVLIETETVTRPLLPADIFLRSGRVHLGFANLVDSSSEKTVRRAAVSFPLIDAFPWYASQGLDDQISLLAGEHAREKPHHLSFAAALLTASGDDAVRRWIRDRLGEAAFWIDFPAASDRMFRFYSSSLILSEATPAKLSGAIVILGSSYDGSADRVRTPLSTSTAPLSGLWGVDRVLPQDLPGAVVHAYVADTLLRHARASAPFHAGPWLATLIALALGCLQAWIGVRLRNLLAAPESVVILPTLYAWLAVWLFQSGVGFLPIVRPIAGFFVGFAMGRHLSLRDYGISAKGA